MIDFNIKLITVFTELHRTKSVSITADRLGLTPSSVSMSLARLRTLFHDPLFVRTGSGMEATPRAAEVVLRLQQAVQLLEAALEARPSFDPAESPREFRVATTDLGEVILIPLLMGALARLAPKVTLRVFHVSQDTPRQLQEGDIDLALGCIVNLETVFFNKHLPGKFRWCGASQASPHWRSADSCRISCRTACCGLRARKWPCVDRKVA